MVAVISEQRGADRTRLRRTLTVLAAAVTIAAAGTLTTPAHAARTVAAPAPSPLDAGATVTTAASFDTRALWDGTRPIYFVPTTNRVVFITVDDGIDRQIRWVQLLRSGRWPIVMFPTGEMTDASPAYWRGMLAAGVPLQDHTYSHPDLRWRSTYEQAVQICAGARSIYQATRTKPTIVRPPYGAWNAGTLQAARQCGMRYVVNWDTVVDHGRITYARGSLRPGSIMLLHLTPNFQTDLTVALEAAQRAGLRPAYLTNYLR